MPRDRSAERKAGKLEEKRQAEQERQREKERDRQREEARREQDRNDALERDRAEALRQQRAEQARARSKERHKAERRARAAQESQREDRRHERQSEGRAASAEAEKQSRQRDERAAARRADAKGAQRDADARAATAASRVADQKENARVAKQDADVKSAAAAGRPADQKESARVAKQKEDARQQRLQDAKHAQRASQQTSRSDEERARAAEDARRAVQREAAAQEKRSADRAEAQAAERRAQVRAQARADERAQQRAAARAQDQNAQQRRDETARRTSAGSASSQSARIPSGHLSNRLPWLKVTGNRIVSAETEKPVILRGVNRSGLEYAAPAANQRFIDAVGITESEIVRIVNDWKANIIRIPFNQDVALNGRDGRSASEYLDDLDQIIYWASSRGAYTLLDLQWLDPTTSFGPGNQVPPLPNLDSLVVWQFLATRYEHEPAVLYDIFNEPHDPLPGDVIPLKGINELGLTSTLTSRSVTMTVWQPWARQLVRAIRRAHMNSLIFVSGVDWGYDLRGMPLTIVPGDPEVFANLVYSTHVYPDKGPPAPAADRATAPRAGIDWRQAFGELASKVPVFAGEWGVRETTYDTDADYGWAERLVGYMSGLQMGWTAWSWADKPRIVRNAQAAQYDPTRYGLVVQHALALP